MKKRKQVKCASGLTGTQGLLRDRYDSFEDFEANCELWSVHSRLGYKTPKTAWQKNPLIRSSVIPSDLQKVKKV